MANTLEDLTARMGPMAEAYRRTNRDDLVNEVHEVERALNGALRRLRRLSLAAGA